ncbi:MAG: hypothetical protein JNK02_07190 [Planctomycetes bacterium]|nr:hypothetical protein [Planctomycetota bacterium]
MITPIAGLLALTWPLSPPAVGPTGADALAPDVRGQPVALLPRGLTSFGAATHAGWVYILGGYHGEPHAYSREGQSGDFLRINLRDPRQFELLDGSGAVQGASLTAHGNHVLRAGGMVARNARGELADLASLADVAAYDVAARTWGALPPLPEPRSSHAAEIVGDTLVVMGGWTLAGMREGRYQDEAVLLDLARPTAGWRTIPQPFRRRALSAARLGTRVAAIGGMDGEGVPSPRVDLLDLAAGTWERGPEFPGPAFGVAACAIDGGLLASGQDGVVWRLDAATLSWTRHGSLCFPRFFHQIVADERGGALVLGGLDRMRKDGRVRLIERLDPRAAGPLVTSFTLPATHAAKNRQGCFLRENELLLFGGNRSTRQHDFGPEDFLDGTHALDLASLSWKARAPFPERRQTITGALLADGRLGLAIGGFGHADGRAQARGAGYRYSFTRDVWERAPGADLVPPRTQFQVVEQAGSLWLFGGVDYDAARDEEDAFRHVSEVLALDLADPGARWVDAGVRLTAPRRAFGCAVLSGRAYLVGGMRDEFELVEECEVFDFRSRSFARIASPARPRLSPELLVVDGRLFLVGGTSRGPDGQLATDRSIERYDPDSDAWEVVVTDLPQMTRHTRAFALRDRIVLVSSHFDGPATTQIVFVAP